MTVTSSLAARLRYWRSHRKLSRRELALALGVTEGTVRFWELEDEDGGTGPRARDLPRIAAALRIRVEDLYGAASPRDLWYLAHPLRGDLEGNLQRAQRLLAALRAAFPADTIVAPWIASVLSGDDDDDDDCRERGLRDAEALIPRLHGVVLTGPRLSPGSLREARAAREVICLIEISSVSLPQPWSGGPHPTLRAWAEVRGRISSAGEDRVVEASGRVWTVGS